MKMYRFKYMVVLLGCVSLGMLQSCSSDEDEEMGKVGGSPEDNETVFLNMVGNSDALMAVGFMKAGDLVKKSGIENHPKFGQMLDQLAMSSGASLESKIYVGVEGTSMEDVQGFMMMSIDDKSQFEAMASSRFGTFRDMNAGVRIADDQQNKGHAVLAVNENLALYVMTAASKNKSGMEEYVAELFKRGMEEGSNANAKSLLARDYDFGMTLNSDRIVEMIPWDMLAMTGEMDEKEIASARESAEKAKGGWTTLGMVFKQGKIVAEAESESPLAKGDEAILTPGGPDPSFANFVSEGKNPMFFMTGSMNLEAMLDLAESSLPQEEMKGFDLIRDVLTNVGTGEGALAILGLPREIGSDDMADVDDNFAGLNDDEPATTAEPGVIESKGDAMGEQMVITVGVNDRSALVALIDTMLKAQESSTIPGVYEIPDKNVYMQFLDGKFVITGNKGIAERLAKDGQLSMLDDAKNNIANSIYGTFYFDALQEKTEGLDQAQIEILNVVNKATFSVDNGKAVFELHLNDDSVNSLELIVTKIMQSNVNPQSMMRLMM